MALTIFNNWAEKTLTGVIFALVCAAAAWYFGQPEIFDPIVLTAVVILAFFFRKDVNVFTVICVLVIARIIEESAWRLLENTYLFKIPLYTALVAVIPFISMKAFKYYLLLFVGFAVGCELYWWSSDYTAPMIYWQVFMVILTAALRRAMIMRNFLFFDLLKDERLKFIDLDGRCRDVYTCLVVVYSLQTFEYYIRHILGFKQVTYFYYSFPFINGGLSLFIIYMLVVESTKHIRRSDLSA